ncbi:MAG TPA: hypothetical protein VGJ69_12295 [Pyrinomonadaceae bacterium]
MLHKRMILLVCVFALCVGARAAYAQDSNQPSRSSAAATREDDTNLDTQLYLILATNRETEESKMPSVLQGVVARLRETLAFKHYSLAASFLNRVKHNGRLEMTWVGGPLLAPASSPMGNPSFNEFTARVRLDTDASGRQVIQMNEFRFGSRVPIITAQTTTTNASTIPSAFPVINYQPVGLRTDISMSEGVPVIAGTLNVGPSGDAIIVVISAKRASN